MFSVKVTLGRQQGGRGAGLDGRQQRAEEQHLHDQRHLVHHQGGQHLLRIVGQQPAACSGMMSSALATRNMGTKANRM
jgi:hypothetical protein